MQFFLLVDIVAVGGFIFCDLLGIGQVYQDDGYYNICTFLFDAKRTCIVCRGHI